MSIVAEAPSFLQVFSNGCVKRFSPKIALASLESSNGYISKDVIIDPLKPITGRMFLPNTPLIMDTRRHNKLPMVVYFHGGGFCIGSTTWLSYHVFLGDLASKVGAIVLAVDYRLAPENRLPIAYKDGYSSLEWLVKNQNLEPWLKQANLSRIFLSGDSTGGNIAHNVAIEIIKSKNDFIKEVEIRGLLLIHPFFGSEMRTPKEMINKEAIEVRMNDMFWKLSIPEGFNRDYFGCNFEMVELCKNEWGQFPNVPN
ncbi:hypothetical protein Cgig2_008329 [Carnegiea gigantea]|uniref:Alpha/beta hydrolase fold-3 domain-containing protein n=1 Tax=Carnegiea gigantea TaxID=171969 RepID=A0A9Q1K7C5_9CARY|nr:hypothetical protein Cgig2_008329 [Carnegiea gigantea]